MIPCYRVIIDSTIIQYTYILITLTQSIYYSFIKKQQKQRETRDKKRSSQM